MKIQSKVTRFNSFDEKSASLILMALLSCLFFVSLVAAQQPDRGFQAANTYAATGLEVVNTTNGNLMLNIPLASLPKGRGTSPGYTVTLQYDSKLWESHQTTRNDNIPDENGNEVYNLSSLNPSPNGGWKVRQAYELQLTNRLLFESPNPCWLHDPVEHLNFIWKLEMVMPGGNIVQFFPETGRGTNVGTGVDGYANVSPNGVLSNNYLVTDHGCAVQPNSANVSTNGMNYISMDGSHLRLFIPYSSSDAALSTRNWQLYSPDGTFVENAPSSTVAQRITDRNGNFVEHRDGKIIDQLGRYIEFDTDGNDQIVRVKGVAGEAVETRIRWSHEGNWVQHKFRTTLSASVPENLRYAYVNEQATPKVEKIIFPQQLGEQSIDFEYNGDATQPALGNYTDGWGEISKITLPTRAYSTFEYGQDGQGGDETLAEDALSRYATGKVLHYNEQYDGQSSSKTASWIYTVGRSGNSVLDPSGASSGNALFYNSSYSSWDSGLAYGGSNSDGSVTNRIWAQDIPYAQTTGWMPPGENAGIGKANAYVKTEFTTLQDANGNISNDSLVAIKDYKYDKNGNVLEVKEYDWVTRGSIPTNGVNYTGVPGGATLKRKTVNAYYNQAADADSTSSNSYSYSNPSSPRLKNVIKSTEIQDGSGSPKARSEFFYDDPSTTGNLKETRVWDNTKGTLNSPDGNGSRLDTGNSISTQTEYDPYGNPTLTTDANGNQTLITYGAVSGGPDGDVPDLYPTQVKTAYQKTIERTVSSTYDFYTGLVTSTTDEDNGLTNATEYDGLGRPTKAITAQGNALESWTTTEYDAVNRRVIVRSDLETKGDGKKVATQFYDELGRVRLTKTLEDAATQSAVNETDGIKVQTRYAFDNPTSPSASNGTYSLTSNPYRAATSGAASGETTMGWSRSYSTRTGKHSEATTFSGAALPAPWGSNSASTGTVTTDSNTDRTLVSDQAGKKRISRMNGLGQLSDVWEVTAQDQNTVPVTFPGQNSIDSGYHTSYNYELLGNLSSVSQGSQTRTFSYSSLSRLISATNPESGAMTYEYDNNGNLKRKTDSRSVMVSYIYDALNRVTQRSYSGETAYTTPTVTYEYDNEPQAHGKLTKISNSISATQFLDFDITGKALTSKQLTDSGSYVVSYVFNLSGALTELTYPSGRKVKNELNIDGSLSQVESKKNANAGYWTYASGFSYTPTGAAEKVQLGNGHWESAGFNSRLQPTQIALGTTANATDILKINYGYGTTQNNGNVLSQQITAPTSGSNPGFTAMQAYTYDSLNRIKVATETIADSPSWKQAFVYDRYGNRNFDEANTTTLLKKCGDERTEILCDEDRKVENPALNGANNRLAAGQGYAYDSAGNLRTDVANTTYVYDGENKQVEVRDSQSNLIGQYFYDGDGKRVKKVSAAETVIFVYDASGKTVAEYSTAISETPQVAYLTSDALGTPRINTSAGGAVIARHDYHPFGEEISTPERTPESGYDSDQIRKKFTGYERDDETGLDYAQARMYSSQTGRFNTCDPVYISKEHPTNPQRWNLYVFVVNNPLNQIDSDGRKPERKIIDVFIAYGNKASPEWKQLRREARKEGITLNIFDGKRATVENFTKSIGTEGRTTVFVGHASVDEKPFAKHMNGESIRGEGLSLGFADGMLTGVKNYGTEISNVDTKASEVAVFACDFTKLRDAWKSSNGTDLLYVDSGQDGATATETANKAALRVVDGLINGESLEEAAKDGQKAYESDRNATCDYGNVTGKCNQGDKLKVIKLPKRGEL